MERRKFTWEFKLEAVRLIKERGVSYVQASQDLGVHMSELLRNLSGASQPGDLLQMRDCSARPRRVGEEVERHILVAADRC